MSTNRLITLVALLMLSLFMATLAAAQVNWQMGFKGGLNVASFYGDDTDGLDSKLGFVGGAVATGMINNNFGIQIEMLYTQKGAKEHVSESIDIPGFGLVSFDGDGLFKYDYIEIPVLAVLSSPVGDAAAFRGMLGPVIAFRARSKIGFDGTVTGLPPINQDFDNDEVKAVDFGGAIGAGMTFDVGTANLVLDARWTAGLLTTDDSAFEFDAKTTTFSFTTGIVFSLGSGI